MKNYQSKQQGFTLIELVVVIVILGIMSAIAVPRFVNLQQDARASVMAGVEGSVRSAATLVYSRALIDGVESQASTNVTINGTAVPVAFGYPTLAGIETVVDLTGATDVVYAAGAGTFTYGGIATCIITYTAAASAGAAPTITSAPAAANC